MLSTKQNLIQKEDMQDHRVEKYEFKSISPMTPSSPNETVTLDEAQTPEVITTTDSKQEKPAFASSLEKELIDRLLQKSDELSTRLASMEIQAQKAEENYEKASQESYKRGIEEGKNIAKVELEHTINMEKEKIVNSIVALEDTLKASQTHIVELEKELSSIAIDMAKEVIIKEIDESSQKVALELAKYLLGSIMDATHVVIKVNPTDYVYLKEHLKNLEKVQLEADNAISRGGVVISSNLGSLDGNIMSRYKVLKQSVLDNLKA
ncbi:flagellar assembly protein H [Helicobacter sp. 13S00401-1]|uniref:flagellar assembly protein FliH n=1 Tax=Helicobacter sp. 13S00401-1 TaxID=1905758 RepID=UPI000BA6D6CC|nr:flagellar assembly protein FliH [Helicobacter sp. 13S00401-1]PAF51181.1 flagellar assembly protein H [Helicobacter sp. 13S00401-1]